MIIIFLILFITIFVFILLSYLLKDTDLIEFSCNFSNFIKFLRTEKTDTSFIRKNTKNCFLAFP